MTVQHAKYGLLAYVLILSVGCFTALAVPGCSGLSMEQKAETIYGTFITAENSAAQVIGSPEISDTVKQKIQVADSKAKPVADALEAAILAYRKDQGNPDLLQKALDIAEPVITAFAGAVP